MMWLMYRPAAVRATDKTAESNETTRFSERELALLAELLQARQKVQHKPSHSVSASEIEERAA